MMVRPQQHTHLTVILSVSLLIGTFTSAIRVVGEDTQRDTEVGSGAVWQQTKNEESVLPSTSYSMRIASDGINVDVRLLPSSSSTYLSAVVQKLGEGNIAGKWIRIESIPTSPEAAGGPPYSLVQGELTGHVEPSFEATGFKAKRGMVCAIAGSDNFIINLIDHDEWSNAFTVIGEVTVDDAESWAALDRLISMPWHNFTHPQYGTVMRMLDSPMPFSVSLLSSPQAISDERSPTRTMRTAVFDNPLVPLSLICILLIWNCLVRRRLNPKKRQNRALQKRKI